MSSQKRRQKDAIVWCPCHGVQNPVEAVRDTLAELVEFIREPSRDELSDIAYGVGRVLGAVVQRPYIRVPGDGLHVAKIEKRMREYGCIRSTRHLKDGRCPNLSTN